MDTTFKDEINEKPNCEFFGFMDQKEKNKNKLFICFCFPDKVMFNICEDCIKCHDCKENIALEYLGECFCRKINHKFEKNPEIKNVVERCFINDLQHQFSPYRYTYSFVQDEKIKKICEFCSIYCYNDEEIIKKKRRISESGMYLQGT